MAAAAAEAAGAYGQAIAKSRAMLDEVLQLYPGTAVAVAVGDEIIWSTAFGFADVDRQRPVSRSTQFRIYEAAMPLTATVMAASRRTAASIWTPPSSATFRSWTSTFPVTIRSLAANLSGVPDFAEGEEEIPGTVLGRPRGRAHPAARLFVRPPGPLT